MVRQGFLYLIKTRKQVPFLFWYLGFHDMLRIDLREQIENIANNPEYVQ